MNAKAPLPKADLLHVLEHAGGAMKNLAGARILITGGTGFFGIWMLESLVFVVNALGIKLNVVVLTRDIKRIRIEFPHLWVVPWITFFHGDVRNFIPPDGGYSHCIHGATPASSKVIQCEPLTMFDICVAGTKNTLEIAAASKVDKFLLISSGAVYGPQPARMAYVDEEWAGGPNVMSTSACYAEGKRVAEHLCSLYAHQTQLRPVIARCWAFLGPHLPLTEHYAAGNFLRDALAGKQISVLGDGKAVRSYLYAADLAVWLWVLLINGQALRPYNVGSNQEVTIGELAEIMAGSVHPAVPVLIADTVTVCSSPQRYVPSITRVNSELDLSVKISLREGIARTVSWMLEN